MFYKVPTMCRAFPGAANVKEPYCQCRRCEFDPWVRGDPGEEQHYSSILAWRNHTDRGAWWAQSEEDMDVLATAEQLKSSSVAY